MEAEPARSTYLLGASVVGIRRLNGAKFDGEGRSGPAADQLGLGGAERMRLQHQ